jgi:hypothetical protein
LGMVIPPIKIPSLRRVNNLYGYDFRRVFIPFRELSFFKGGCVDFLAVSIILDIECHIGASGDLDLSADPFHGSSFEEQTS